MDNEIPSTVFNWYNEDDAHLLDFNININNPNPNPNNTILPIFNINNQNLILNIASELFVIGAIGMLDMYNDGALEEFMNSTLNIPQPPARREMTLNITSQTYDTIHLPKEEDRECPICMGDYVDRDMVSVLHCKHLFHTPCIEKWGKTNPICPVCRNTIDQLD